MSEIEDKKIAQLESDVRVAQEMLFLVLDALGETVYVPTAGMRDRFTNDRMIDVTITEDEKFWAFSVKEVPSESL